MKVRIGFVSNSSTSSFVIAGIKFSSSDIEFTEELLDKLYENFTVLKHTEDGAPKGFAIIGKWIAEVEYESLDYTENSIEQLQKMTEAVAQEVTELIGKDLPSMVKGVFTGTRCC
jgi:archaellum component FlaC